MYDGTVDQLVPTSKFGSRSVGAWTALLKNRHECARLFFPYHGRLS